MQREAKLGLAVFIGAGLAASALFSRLLFNSNTTSSIEAQTQDAAQAPPVPEISAAPAAAPASAASSSFNPAAAGFDSAFDMSQNSSASQGKANSSSSATVSAQEPVSYVIQSGDNLWKISLAMYGAGRYTDNIKAANPDVCMDGNLKVGTKIIIPPVNGASPHPAPAAATAPVPVSTTVATSASTATSASSAAAPAASATGTRRHTIEAGDTLATIAKKYYNKSADWQKIVDANPGLNPRSLKLGQEIIIP